MKSNGHAVRAIRQRSGLSATQLADAIGVTRPFISNIERNYRNGSPEVIKAIADALKVPITAILLDAPNQDAA